MTPSALTSWFIVNGTASSDAFCVVVEMEMESESASSTGQCFLNGSYFNVPMRSCVLVETHDEKETMSSAGVQKTKERKKLMNPKKSAT